MEVSVRSNLRASATSCLKRPSVMPCSASQGAPFQNGTLDASMAPRPVELNPCLQQQGSLLVKASRNRAGAGENMFSLITARDAVGEGRQGKETREISKGGQRNEEQ